MPTRVNCGLAILLGSVLLAGCLPPEVVPRDPLLTPGQLENPDDLALGTAHGFLFDVGGLRVFPRAADAPVGATAVGGATISIMGGGGAKALAEVVTQSNGRFELAALPWGLVTLAIRRNAASAEPDLVFPFTAISDADIALGEAPVVGREAAITMGLDGVNADALVLGTLQPLPAGTLVHPSGTEPEGSPFARQLLMPAWFFFVDEEPLLRFGHAATYVYVDAATGEVTRVAGIRERPRINYAMHWGADTEMFEYDGIDFDAIAAGAEIPAVYGVAPGAEVVQLPDVTLDDVGPEPAAPLGDKNHNADPESIFVLVLNCTRSLDGTADARKVLLFCNINGIPMENRRIVETSTQAPLKVEPAYNDALAELNGLIEDRLDLGLHSTLIVYVTAHGSLEDGMPTGEIKIELADREYDWTGKQLKLKTTKACRVRLIVDACYSTRFVRDAAADILSLPPPDRPDFIGLASASDDQGSLYIPSWLNTLSLGTLSMGGRFTNTLVSVAGIAGGDLSNILDATGTAINPDLDVWGSQTSVAYTFPNVAARCIPPVGEGEGEGYYEGEGQTEGEPVLDDMGFLLEQIGGANFAETALSTGQALPVGIARPTPSQPTGTVVPHPTAEINFQLDSVIALDEAELERLFLGEAALFPCGAGEFGETACALSVRTPVGPWLLLGSTVQEALPLPGTDYRYNFQFLFESDGVAANNWVKDPAYPSDYYQGTDRWYQPAYNPTSANPWSFLVSQYDGEDFDFSNSGARMIVRGNAILLAVPLAELPAGPPMYRQTIVRVNTVSPFDRTQDFHPDLPGLFPINSGLTE